MNPELKTVSVAMATKLFVTLMIEERTQASNTYYNIHVLSFINLAHFGIITRQQTGSKPTVISDTMHRGEMRAK